MQTTYDLDDVLGFDAAQPRTSFTTAEGALRIEPIDGVKLRQARPVSHDKGHLTEAFRADWGLTEAPIVQVNVTTANRSPRMNAPPAPLRWPPPASLAPSPNGSWISYQLNREPANHRNSAATVMFTQGLAANVLAPPAPRRTDIRNPSPVNVMMIPSE